MLIAILMTNTDESDFASRHPKDGEKFQDLIVEKRPEWRFEVYSVKDNIFPDDMKRFDGVIVTGSPASVRDGEPWIARLENMIRELVSANIRVFGACFGHQVIATALGGEVDYNPDGWSLGTVTTEIMDGEKGGKLNLYAAHKEQVTVLPDGAKIVATSPGCPIAGFSFGNQVLTTQYHPEMTPEFIEALLVEMEGDVSEDILEQAKKSLATQADRDAISEMIVNFLEFA